MAPAPKCVQQLVRGDSSMQTATDERRNGESGFTLIDMLFVLAILSLLAALAIPGLMRARGTAQSASALGTMRLINGAQLSYAISCGYGFYSPDLPTLGVPPPGSVDSFLNNELTTGVTVVRSGYVFSLAGTPLAGAPPTCNGLGGGQAAPGYAAVADPLDTSHPAKYFGTNADGLIYQDTGTYAATMPESGPPPGGAPIQ
jgi:prepilin-type N-terminal cleavage/methylation domain-containing protein